MALITQWQSSYFANIKHETQLIPHQDIWPQLDITDRTPFKAISKTAQEDTVQSLMEEILDEMVPDSTLAATSTSNYYWLATPFGDLAPDFALTARKHKIELEHNGGKALLQQLVVTG